MKCVAKVWEARDTTAFSTGYGDIIKNHKIICLMSQKEVHSNNGKDRQEQIKQKRKRACDTKRLDNDLHIHKSQTRKRTSEPFLWRRAKGPAWHGGG